jgi:hypothetical protein
MLERKRPPVLAPRSPRACWGKSVMKHREFRQPRTARSRAGCFDTFDPIRDPFEAAFAQSVKFLQPFHGSRTTQRNAEPAIWNIENASGSSLGGSLSSGRGLISKLFLSVCAGILRIASACIAERSFHLFAPVVDGSILGAITDSEGIGARLIQDRHAVTAFIPRRGRPLYAPDHAALFWSFRPGHPW